MVFWMEKEKIFPFLGSMVELGKCTHGILERVVDCYRFGVMSWVAVGFLVDALSVYFKRGCVKSTNKDDGISVEEAI